jgi:predicted metal-binding membrane protein
MLARAVVMFVEKAVAWGRTMTVVVGVGLAGWGSGLLLGIPGLPRPL